jgi:hypothetical protein
MRNGIDSFSFKKLGKDERACTHWIHGPFLIHSWKKKA